MVIYSIYGYLFIYSIYLFVYFIYLGGCIYPFILFILMLFYSGDSMGYVTLPFKI